jgi:hypothetical protein
MMDLIESIFVRGIVFFIVLLALKAPVLESLQIAFGLSLILEILFFLLHNVMQVYAITRRKFSIAVAVSLLLGMCVCSGTFAVLINKLGGH